tara:strand:+ start:1237 stop:2217 length:981 start_codon:yes stop_codon:yes gene_type:complete
LDNQIEKIKVSVIIPVFNRENTIAKCINSILNQSYLPNEIIVVDDGSVDNTVEEVKKLNSPLLKIINNKVNKGAQHVRNQGIKSAKYDWIAFLDSDDTWTINKLEKQIRVIEQNNCNPFLVVNTKCKRIYEDNKKAEIWELPAMHGPSIEVHKKLLVNPGPMLQGMLTSKVALEKIGYLDETIISFQEWDTSIRLSKICEFHWIDEPLFNYFIPVKETSFKNKEIWIKGYLSIIQKNKNEIIKIYESPKHKKLIYNSLKDVGNWEEWDLLEQLIREYRYEIHKFQKLKLIYYKLSKSKPNSYDNLRLLINKPIIGLKHIIKEKLNL